MIRVLLILCCFFCVQDEVVMSWNASYKLSWSDFKGKPDQSVSAVAITASGISFGFSTKETDSKIISFSTEVFCHFFPNNRGINLILQMHMF